jgi:hypothetical protein
VVLDGVAHVCFADAEPIATINRNYRGGGVFDLSGASYPQTQWKTFDETQHLNQTLLWERKGEFMAATAGQGRSFTTFLVGLTVACAGIAAFATGLGKILLVIGLIMLVGSVFNFLKIKPLEGPIPENASPTTMKIIGVFLAAFGWAISLFGMHVVDGTKGRIVLALVGIAVSLVGMIVVLPAAFNKHAIWKA